MSTDVIVQTHNLTKTYDFGNALSEANMRVDKGTIYGFLGANGAGKTTMFKLLTGLLKPTNGIATVCGLNVADNRTEILHKIGVLIETPVFYEHLSAIENLEIHLAYMGKNGDVMQTLTNVGLQSTGNKPVGKFSLGMRQRLAIARAIIYKPDLLILDEPVNGLDPIGIKEMRFLFQKLVDNGMTILLSSHILSEIELLADTIGVIVRGKIIQETSLAELKKRIDCSLEDYLIKIMGEYQWEN